MSTPTWRAANGWREIFARIFVEFTPELNVTPDWLVNPTTNRRLKLDMLYPKIGVAVRLEGVQGAGRRPRLSLEEEAQKQVREDARVTVCRRRGIELIVVEVDSEKIGKIFQAIEMALSRAGQKADAQLRPSIRQARHTASAIGLKIKSPADLNLYADLWNDRQYRTPEPAAAPTPAAEPARPVDFAVGMAVEHPAFGPGAIISIVPSGGDTLIAVDFVTAGQKTLAASLVAGKLKPR